MIFTPAFSNLLKSIMDSEELRPRWRLSFSGPRPVAKTIRIALMPLDADPNLDNKCPIVISVPTVGGASILVPESLIYVNSIHVGSVVELEDTAQRALVDLYTALRSPLLVQEPGTDPRLVLAAILEGKL